MGKKIKVSFWASYKGFYRSLKLYYTTYGGIYAAIRSPYLLMGLAVTLLCRPYWWCLGEPVWYSLVINIIPSLLGFTLGGYAVLLAVGSDDFREFISGGSKNGKKSAFMTINATFVHFIFLQIVALVLALVGSAMGIKSGILPLFGFFFFTYALMTSIAAAFALLRLAKIYDRYVEKKKVRKLRKIERWKLLAKKRNDRIRKS